MGRRTQEQWIAANRRRKAAGLTWRRKPIGFLALLTPEQRAAILAYDGPQNFGDPAYRIGGTPVE